MGVHAEVDELDAVRPTLYGRARQRQRELLLYDLDERDLAARTGGRQAVDRRDAAKIIPDAKKMPRVRLVA